MTVSREDLKRLCEGATAGPWSWQYDKIFAPSERGGSFNVADVRGWGFFTGNGHGGLALPEKEAVARQDANAAFIAAARTALPALLAEVERLEAELAMIDATLARRPALADLPTRGLQIARAIRVASEADEAKARAEAAESEAAALRQALEAVLADIADYERVNNLAPSPGKPDCWQSVTRAKSVLAGGQSR